MKFCVAKIRHARYNSKAYLCARYSFEILHILNAFLWVFAGFSYLVKSNFARRHSSSIYKSGASFEASKLKYALISHARVYDTMTEANWTCANCINTKRQINPDPQHAVSNDWLSSGTWPIHCIFIQAHLHLLVLKVEIYVQESVRFLLQYIEMRTRFSSLLNPQRHCFRQYDSEIDEQRHIIISTTCLSHIRMVCYTINKAYAWRHISQDKTKDVQANTEYVGIYFKTNIWISQPYMNSHTREAWSWMLPSVAVKYKARINRRGSIPCQHVGFYQSLVAQTLPHWSC